jgi:uncharacterized protein YpuA (DUF1002 family)
MRTPRRHFNLETADPVIRVQDRICAMAVASQVGRRQRANVLFGNVKSKLASAKRSEPAEARCRQDNA